MKKLDILIVEDEVMTGLLPAEVLTDRGHEICAIEATEAGPVAAAAEFKPDLMIVDAGLRRASGISAVERILRSGFVPHIFVSGGPLLERSANPGGAAADEPIFSTLALKDYSKRHV